MKKSVWKIGRSISSSAPSPGRATYAGGTQDPVLGQGQRPDKRTVTVKRAMEQLLRPYRALVHTIMADNGLEFSHHAYMAQQLDAAIYLVDPYASGPRDWSEPTHSRMWEYFPKWSRLTSLRPAAGGQVTDGPALARRGPLTRPPKRLRLPGTPPELQGPTGRRLRESRLRGPRAFRHSPP